MRRHVFRNAMNPVLTAASGWFASMLAGAVFVEYVFGWNGMGCSCSAPWSRVTCLW